LPIRQQQHTLSCSSSSIKLLVWFQTATPSHAMRQVIADKMVTHRPQNGCDVGITAHHGRRGATVLVAVWRRLALQSCAGDDAVQLLHSEVHNDIRADMRLRACRCGCSRGERGDTLC
jgi:hypothetical protein